MCPFKPEEVFADSFDTFKAFKNISFDRLKSYLDFPTTLWQILNHLIIWQEWQLATLREKQVSTSFDESKTWLTDKYPISQEKLDQAVDTFQGNAIRTCVLLQTKLTSVASLSYSKKTKQERAHLQKCGYHAERRKSLGSGQKHSQENPFVIGV